MVSLEDVLTQTQTNTENLIQTQRSCEFGREKYQEDSKETVSDNDESQIKVLDLNK